MCRRRCPYPVCWHPRVDYDHRDRRLSECRLQTRDDRDDARPFASVRDRGSVTGRRGGRRVDRTRRVETKTKVPGKDKGNDYRKQGRHVLGGLWAKSINTGRPSGVRESEPEYILLGVLKNFN